MENARVIIIFINYFDSYNVFNNEDSWNGLTLKYKIEHPLTLLITPSL